MSEVWHARSGIVARGRARGRVRSRWPGGLIPGTRQRPEALPDPRSPRGWIYPLARLIAIAVCVFTAAGNDRFTAVRHWSTSALMVSRGGTWLAEKADLAGKTLYRSETRP
jgi:hypothetical protein